MKRILAQLFFAAVVTAAHAQISLTTTTYTQDFNAYAGTSTTVPIGWTASGSSKFNGTGVGSSNAGGFYSFGASGEGSLGFLHSGTSGTGTYSVDFTNNLSTPITALTITFSYEQWRYAQNNSGWDLSGTGVLSGNSLVDAADFLGAGTGSSTGSAGAVSTTPIVLNLTGLDIEPGDTFGFSWAVTDAGGSDNGVAIDDFSLAAVTPVPEPGTVALLTASAGVFVLVLRRRRTA